ncbi:MAG TPA: hypothetical protein ENK45_03675 [Aliiroseovarius sp.]|nr:hypothetical protein [Aliiroseovarius sp.]
MDHKITLTLDDPLLRAARDVARIREIALQQLLKDALKAELARAHRRARSPVRADERMIAMMRARLSEDFAYARDWFDLIDRLRDKGVVLREAGGGLALFSAPTGSRICKASDVGFSLNRLARQFQAPFPGDKLGQGALYAQTTPSWELRVLEAD